MAAPLGAPPLAALAGAPALAALGRVRFSTTRDQRSIWADSAEHVPALHGGVVARLIDDFDEQTRPDASDKPLGWVVIGTAGAGKTHLLGTLRRRVWERGGWFVLLDLLDVNDFWSTAALGFVDSLRRPMPGGMSQGLMLFERLRARFGLPPALAERLAEAERDAWDQVARGFATAVRREDPNGSLAHRDVLLAFLGLLSGSADLQDFARAWLTGVDVEQAGKAALGLLRSALSPRRAVEGLSWLMALGGPTLCALDQIDAIVSVAHLRAGDGCASDDLVQNRARAVIDELAGGLMDLRSVTQRTVTAVAALEATWEVLRTRALAPFRDRFGEIALRQIGSAEAARHMVETRLAAAYHRAGFAPPYPSWPFRPEAFGGVGGFSPRGLLLACQAHIDACLDKGGAEELVAFPNAGPASDLGAAPVAVPRVPVAPLAAGRVGTGSPLDERYAALCAMPPPPGLLALGGDDARVVELLLAALRALARQSVLPETQDLIVEDDTTGLHARLRHIDNAAGGTERHHCFRVLPHTQAIAVLNRLQAAITASGIDRELPFRRLVVLRRSPWPGGPKTAAKVREFELRGGVVLAPDEADFARFAALRTLLAETPAGLDGWLRARRPLADSPFFRGLGLVDDPPAPVVGATVAGPADAAEGGATVVAAVPADVAAASAGLPLWTAARTGPASAPDAVPPAAPTEATPAARPAVPPAPQAAGPPPAAAIPLGIRAGDGQPVLVPLAMLPRHLAVIAGAGSGKTVLLRRLIEEAALAGLPSIVLDSNNDLVRLADRWPERPAAFTAADAAKAARFHEVAEVVVWTPGRARGNPLALAPLPDFAALTDAEECDAAVGMAAATLERLIATGGARGQLRAGVLTDALRHFARRGGGRLQDLVTLLRELPAEASDISGAPRLAGEIADALLAARTRNPLLDGAGTPLSAAVLLAGTAGRVRISVVNLAGLPGEEARQDFVGRLLMALFGHVRRHPAAPGQPAAGLLVMDEAQNFAPSDRRTASGEATVALVRQARKYGLGMVFATQAPKAINHNVIANCTTQLFGLTNSPAALDAVREMLRSRGGGGEELGRLPRGQFYLTTEGLPRPQKLMAPLCLTCHPPSPPSEDEVIERAARSRVGAEAPRPDR